MLDKYGDEDVYEAFLESFETLQLAAEVNGDYLCVHGGISDRLTNLNDINKIDRRMEPEDDTLLADLLWADPARNKDADRIDYIFNEERNISCKFGKAPLKALLKRENLKALVRAHQL